MLYSSVTIGNIFFQAAIIFATNFCELVHRKHLYCQLIVAFGKKKNLKIKAERRRNHWRRKRVVFQKIFWTSPRKTGNFEGIVFFLVWSMKSVERVSQLISVECQRICFLFVDWTN